MPYEYKIHLFIKTTNGDHYLDSQICEIITRALDACPEFRDVFICEFENQLDDANDGWTSAPSSVVKGWQQTGVNPVSFKKESAPSDAPNHLRN